MSAHEGGGRSAALQRRLRRRDWLDRVGALSRALGIEQAASPALDELLGRLRSSPDAAWLTLAVLGRALPSLPEVRQFQRLCELEGPAAALLRVPRRAATGLGRAPELIGGDLLIDQTGSPARDRWTVAGAAGASVARWARDGGLVLASGARVVPWRARLIAIGEQREPALAQRLAAAAELSNSRTVAVGYGVSGLVPPSDDVAGYATYLSSIQRFAAVCAPDQQALEEMRGWASMLPGAGITAPTLSMIDPPASPDDPEEWASYLEKLAALAG